MEKMRICELAEAIGCESTDCTEITEISTDSRAVPPGCLFIAIEGERFDGHEYVEQALESGAAYAVIHHDCPGSLDPGRIFRVENTQDALLAIGKYYRERYDICCVGITGSVGKTTMKDMIAAVLAADRPTLKTEGNLNNEIGLPKTLLRLDCSYRAAVIEMGMQGLGEIAILAEAACPTIGVITNIGVAHLQQLGTRENILKAKLELADALPDGAPLLICADNDLLRTVEYPRLRVLTYGVDNSDCDLCATQITEQDGHTSFNIVHHGRALTLVENHQADILSVVFGPVTIPCIGRHNVCNALAAFAVGRLMNIDSACCAQALKGYQPSGMRQKIVKWNGCTVVEDCYNASPDSMQAALRTLGEYRCNGKRIAVLADMLELGKISKQAHYEVGIYAAKQGIDLILAYGKEAKGYVEGAIEGKIDAEYFEEKHEIASRIHEKLTNDSVIWVKGSRGMKMEEILQELYGEGI